MARSLPGATKATGLLGPVLAYLASQPFILLFFVVAVGYAIGRITFWNFNLGATASTLVLGLLLSLWASLRGVTFAVPDFASTLFFNLFMFAVGLKVGPQFLSGLRRGARAFIVMGLLVPLLSVGLVFLMRVFIDMPAGLTSGILAGANTATPGIGAAKGVYQTAAGGGAEAISNLSTAFAFGYCISLVSFVLMMKWLPGWFGKDARKEAQALQREIEAGSAHPLPGTAKALETVPLEVRVFQVAHSELENRSLGELRRSFPRVAVERLRRGGVVLEATDSLQLEAGDTVAISGPLASLVNAGRVLGPELPDDAMRSIGMETVEVVARARRAGQRIDEIMRTVGHGFSLNALFRSGTEIPHGPDTVVEKGDVFRITGSSLRIKHLEQSLGGQAVHASVSTDIVTLAVGLSVGAFLGTIPIHIAGLKLNLGSAVGLLVTGIVLSILRTRNPMLGGPFPEPARQLVEDLGLNVFIAITSLNAGAGVIQAVRGGAMLPMIFGTLLVGLIPPVVGWIVGQYRFHLNAGLLTGAVTGARCSSPGLRTAQEMTQSTVPALSYPVTFAISNVVITLFCYLFATFDLK